MQRKYYGLHPNFKKAFDYINENNIENLEEGAFEIGEGLKLIVIVGQGNTKEEAVKGFECHDKNIDIQISIKGPETFAWKPREKCVNPNGDYSDEKDVRFFHDAPDTFLKCKKTICDIISRRRSYRNDWRRYFEENCN